PAGEPRGLVHHTPRRRYTFASFAADGSALPAEGFSSYQQGLIMSTYTPKPGEIQMDWHVVDATGKVLGRMAAKIAMILKGKTKPTYTPHVDTVDFVIVLNADKIKVT